MAAVGGCCATGARQFSTPELVRISTRHYPYAIRGFTCAGTRSRPEAVVRARRGGLAGVSSLATHPRMRVRARSGLWPTPSDGAQGSEPEDARSSASYARPQDRTERSKRTRCSRKSGSSRRRSPERVRVLTCDRPGMRGSGNHERGLLFGCRLSMGCRPSRLRTRRAGSRYIARPGGLVLLPPHRAGGFHRGWSSTARRGRAPAVCPFAGRATSSGGPAAHRQSRRHGQPRRRGQASTALRRDPAHPGRAAGRCPGRRCVLRPDASPSRRP